MLEDLHAQATDQAREAASVGFLTVAKRIHGLDGVFLFLAAGGAFGLGWFDAAKSAARRRARAEEADLVVGPSSIGGSPLRALPPPSAAGPSIGDAAARDKKAA
jgi:hypothetical protein